MLIQNDEDFVLGPPDLPLEQSWGYSRLFDIGDPANPQRYRPPRAPPAWVLAA